MGLVGFLLFFVKCCVDFLAWPLLALAYPLYASIRAIETNSVMDTQKLNTYWIVFSLILLIEHALSLSMWFPFWPYIRLIIVFLVVIPYFDGAFYVYKQVICPFLSMDYHIMMNWFTIRKEASIETEKVLAEVEKYIKENGTEALEKIIASKSGSTKNLEVREIEALSSTDNDGVNQPNSDGPHVERKNIEAVEEIEKNEAAATTQVSRVVPELTQTKSRMALLTETRESVSEVQAGRDHTHSPVSKVVQKEWTCTVCQVTTNSLMDLFSHFRGKKHEATMNEAAKAKNQTIFPEVVCSHIPKKYDHPAEDNPRKNANNQTVFPKVIFSHIPKESVQSTDGIQNGWSDGLEPRVTTDERFFQGKQKSVGPASSPNKSNEREEEEKIGLSNSKLKQKTNMEHEDKVQGRKPANQKKGKVEAKDSSLQCRVCNISCTGNVNMEAHLRGKKHLTRVKLLASK